VVAWVLALVAASELEQVLALEPVPVMVMVPEPEPEQAVVEQAHHHRYPD
jgi:hypothetical protein